jgi:NADH:ubiquinone oxidoreductase subunit F (NADH-binding)
MKTSVNNWIPAAACPSMIEAGAGMTEKIGKEAANGTVHSLTFSVSPW